MCQSVFFVLQPKILMPILMPILMLNTSNKELESRLTVSTPPWADPRLFFFLFCLFLSFVLSGGSFLSPVHPGDVIITAGNTG